MALPVTAIRVTLILLAVVVPVTVKLSKVVVPVIVAPAELMVPVTPKFSVIETLSAKVTLPLTLPLLGVKLMLSKEVDPLS